MVVKTQFWIEFLKLNLFLVCFSKKNELSKFIKIRNYKANYLLPKPIISAYKFFDTLFEPTHSMLYHFVRSVIFFFIHLFINKERDNNSLYSYCNFIKHACFAYANLIFCYCSFWKKLCFIDRKAYFKHQFDSFWNATVFSFSYLFSIDICTIENHVHPLHIIVDRNQEFIYVYFHVIFRNARLVRKKIVELNVKSKNGKFLDCK